MLGPLSSSMSPCKINYWPDLTPPWQNYSNQVLRNASETAKRIKEIKEVLQNTSWAKYLVYDDFEEIKRKMLSELSNTNESFVNLRKILQDGKK